MIRELEDFKNVYIDYVMDEFGLSFMEAKDEVRFINQDSIVPIAFTTLGDGGELEIQVNLDINKARLESHVYGVEVEEVEYLQYEDLRHATYDLNHSDFVDLIRLNELDVDELVEKDKRYRENIG